MMRIFLLAAFVAIGFLSSCGGKKSANQNMMSRAAPVLLATVSRQTVPLDINAIGNVEAYSSVQVKSLVDGALTEVHFKEGQYVRQGDLLFTIDPRPFDIALRESEVNLAKDLALSRQAGANLARDAAQEKNAQAQAKRYEILLKQNYVSKQDADQFRTNAEAAVATVLADQSAVDSSLQAAYADENAIQNAKLQLQHCYIRSPIDARTGALLVHQGNLVKANDVPLVILNQVIPIYVTFTVPEQQFAQIQHYIRQGPLTVKALLPDAAAEETGQISFVDNAVDLTTGTLKLKGVFPNRDQKLWPGAFVNVTLRLSLENNAIVVPSRAVQTGQQGSYVFVVKPDMTVDMVPVDVERTVGDRVIIRKGLSAGQTVVTDGQLGLVPGAQVIPKKEQPAP